MIPASNVNVTANGLTVAGPFEIGRAGPNGAVRWLQNAAYQAVALANFYGVTINFGSARNRDDNANISNVNTFGILLQQEDDPSRKFGSALRLDSNNSDPYAYTPDAAELTAFLNGISGEVDYRFWWDIRGIPAGESAVVDAEIPLLFADVNHHDLYFGGEALQELIVRGQTIYRR